MNQQRRKKLDELRDRLSNLQSEASTLIADRARGWARYCSKSCKAMKQELRTGQHAAYQERRDQESEGIEGGLCFPSHAEGEVQ